MIPELDVRAAGLAEIDLVNRIVAGEYELFEIVMRRHNQQLYRAAHAIIGNDLDVEDVMQQAYLNAFAHLEQFEARSQLSTWLTRIVINEAYARRRRLLRTTFSSPPATEEEAVASRQPSPEQQTYVGELNRVLEKAVDELPEPYRIVFVLRDVEGMSTAEAAAALALGDEAVKTRLHRARTMLRRALTSRIGAAASSAFPFHASRCDRVVAAVMPRLMGPPAPLVFQ